MANAASTPILTSAPTVGFPQFPRLPENSGDGRPGGDDFILFSGQNLERQIRRASTLLRVNKETRQLVQDALTNTIQFRRFSPMSEPNQPPEPVDASIRSSEDTDIIWLEFPPRLADFHFPAHLNTFRLCDGAKAARNVGFVLPDGRRTLLDPMTRFTTPHMLKQFSGLENFYYGLSHDDLVEAGRERYPKLCFRDADCHIFSLDAEGDAFYHSSGSDWEEASDVGIEVLYGHFGLIWHWPKPGSHTEERIPCVISKVVRPIQSTIDELGWRCIPVFEFDDIYDTHNQLLREATLGQALPELPDGSEISEAGSEISEPGYPSHPHGNAGDCDCDCPVHGHEEPPSGILGARQNPLPYELRDSGVVDEVIGYQDSDEGESLEDDQEAPAFHKFTNLPIELRYRIWEAYCPDLTTPGRMFEFDITNSGPDNEPSNYKAYAGETTQDVTRKIRKALAIHRQSRNMALGLLPDTLDFNIRPGDSSDYPAASLRFRKETDIICFRRPQQLKY